MSTLSTSPVLAVDEARYSPVWQRSLTNFERASALLDLEPSIAVRLKQPERVLIVSCPVKRDDGRVDVFTGYRVQHNSSLGPYKGGIRFARELDLGEMTALAMDMTWKTALIGLPLGGAKGGVCVDTKQFSEAETEQLTRRYTTEILRIIGPEVDIPAPDMGTTAKHMAWIMDTYSAHVGFAAPEIVTGKPVDLGGSLLRAESTGVGVVYTIEEACKHLGMQISGASFVVQGIGNVGGVAAAEMARRGGTCVAISDSGGGVVNAAGINVADVIAYRDRVGSLEGCPLGDKVGPNDVLTVPCDILIPAAVGGVLNAGNAGRVRCRILAEGANHPTTPEADAVLTDAGVFIIPDILCNAGGVTVSYFEWVQGGMHFFWSGEEIDQRLSRLLREAFARTVSFARDRGTTTRLAAWALGIDKVARVMKARGLYA